MKNKNKKKDMKSEHEIARGLLNIKSKEKDFLKIVSQKTLDQLKVVEVFWEDANMSSKTYFDIEEAQNCQASPSKSVGYLISEDKNRVVLSQLIHYHPKGYITIGSIHTIPQGMITKIIKLKFPKKTKKKKVAKKKVVKKKVKKGGKK